MESELIFVFDKNKQTNNVTNEANQSNKHLKYVHQKVTNVWMNEWIFTNIDPSTMKPKLCLSNMISKSVKSFYQYIHFGLLSQLWNESG